MKSKLLQILFAASCAGFAGPAAALFDPVNDDTDIFLANPAFDAIRPNVLIFLDNSANWGQSADGADKFAHEKAALVQVISELSSDFNVGLGFFTQSGDPGESGAFIRYAVRQMTPTNKARLVDLIGAFSESGDRASGARWSVSMMELHRYFAGSAAYAGHDTPKRDYAGNTVDNPYAAALPRNAFTSAASTTYVTPITDACQKNFIIFISNGEPNDASSGLAVAESNLAALAGASPQTINLTPAGQEGNWSDEYAKYMANADCNTAFAGVQNVYTYTVDVVPKADGQGPDTTALLQSMAIHGKGKYFAVSGSNTAAQLTAALKAIFNEVQAKNSVFASTTLPVSVNVRGTNLNQVYIGVFRPDATKSPRWWGNLKMYKLGVDTATETLFLADANGDAAEDGTEGFIRPSALSFWTGNSTYWAFRDPEVNGPGGASDAPDGDLVEKGGAAQRQRVRFATTNAPRKLYTCTDGAGGLCDNGDALSATPFDTTTISAADVGAYATKPVVTLTSSGTTAIATVTAHGWSSGDVIRIEGASPSVYNQDAAISVVDANTFRYTLPSAANANMARVNAPGHLLVSGDVACVDALPAGYFNCTAPGYAPVTKEDDDNFLYPMTGAEATDATSFVVFGGRLITSVMGIPGASPPRATIHLPNHGFGAAGLLTNFGYLFSAIPDWYDADNKPATIVDANTISIEINNAINTSTYPPNIALVTSSHDFTDNQSITIFGSAVAAHNGVKTITRLSSTQFTFASTATTADTVSTMRAGHRISSITHPNSGSGTARDTATVTTAAAHGYAVNQTINIFGTGAFPGVCPLACGYDGSWVIQSTPSATTFTIFNAAIDSRPATVTPATGIAGFTVTRIEPALKSTGVIHFYRDLLVNSIKPAALAQGSITAGKPSDGDTTVRDAIVNWVRSSDNRDNEDGNGVSTDVRASVHGDVLHSRPATINYSRFPADTSQPANDNDVYVFYGSNDGLLRAVKGGTASDEAGIAPGDERWSFIPREFFPKMRRLREQSPTIANVTPKDYFFDGSIGVYHKDLTPSGGRAGTIGDHAGDKANLYVSLRRGGDFIYALDVTDPAAPKLLWRKGRGDPGWDEIGQTWSEPKVTRINWAFDTTNNPDNVVLAFGAGYDAAVDDINACLLAQFNTTSVVQKAIGTGSVTYTVDGTCTITGATGSPTTVTRSKGRGILVVDAFSGNVLWQAGPAPTGATHNLAHTDMTCAIPSDLSVLDRNRDGFADRLYTGDTCGNVWRAEIGDADPTNWKVTKIAALSSGINTDITGKRKFLFPPDLVLAKDGLGTHFAVLIGSGDREHPFDANVQNAFFMIKDRDASGLEEGVENASTKSINVPNSTATLLPISSTDVFDATNVDGVNDFGWKINLRAGEKNVGTAVTISSTTFFNTNQPSSTAGGGSCGSNLGIARQYLVSYVDASATTDLNALGTLSIANRSTIHAGGGYLPSPVPVVVEIDGKRYQAVISGTSVQNPPGLTLDSRVRTYWYREIDQ